MARFSAMNSAGRVELARMPPTLAAARNMYSGRSFLKYSSTADCRVKSSSARERRSKFEYPSATRRRAIADPTIPLCPATKMEEDLFIAIGAATVRERVNVSVLTHATIRASPLYVPLPIAYAPAVRVPYHDR